MILTDASRHGPSPTVLDIGCGDGFDGNVPLQRSVAEIAGRFIGIEPDPAVPLGDYLTESHRCLFEHSPIEPGVVDLAYAIMVLEHLPDPQAFWDKLLEVLAAGGVFWGMTVDARHPFCRYSSWAHSLRIKDLYLDLVLGRKADGDRYRNYSTYYRSNTPRQIERLARGFRHCECINLSRVGQWSSYLPDILRPIADWADRRSIRNGHPGTLLIIRVQK
jgi:SAM-dependent methyltransferase